MQNITIDISGWDWVAVFGHFLILSLLSVGGAITTAPDMQRYLVLDNQWLTPAQFGNSIAIAQAAPGPNVLFVALLGLHLGLNAGGYDSANPTVSALLMGALGVVVLMAGIMLPSATLTLLAARWAHQNSHKLQVKAFKQGLTPVVIGLVFATSWVMLLQWNCNTSSPPSTRMTTWLSMDPMALARYALAAATAILAWRTRLHILAVVSGRRLCGRLRLGMMVASSSAKALPQRI